MPPSIPSIGAPLPRPEAKDKALGRQRFAADFHAPEMLWAQAVRAGIPAGELRGIDTRAARSAPGVLAVLTAADVPGPGTLGVVRRDQRVLADKWVRHAGDAVALVVAESREASRRGAALVKVDLIPQAPLDDPQAALAPGARPLHDDAPQGNLLLEGRVTLGRGAAALADCAHQVAVDLELPRQEHAYLETECGWARWDPGQGMVITASTQTPFRDKAEVAEALSLDLGQVRVIAPPPGGAFGGKDGVTVQALLGLAALGFPGRPVKMHWDRAESFLAGSKRHPARVRVRLGADDQGRLQAAAVEHTFDTGAYDHLGGVVMALALEHGAGPYRIPHVELEGRAVYTNNPLGGAFRGFGGPQATAGIETAVDRLARRMGVCPLELRRRHAVGRGDVASSGLRVTGSCGLDQCLEAVAGHQRWRERTGWKAAAPRHRLRGVGVACASHGVGYGTMVPDTAGAKVELTRAGRFRIYSGVVDMGQGNSATALQMAGDRLSQALENLELVQPDTGLTLNSGSASASRTTFTYAQALLLACADLRTRLLARAAELLFAPGPESLALVPGGVADLASGREMSLADLAARLDPGERSATARWRAPVAQGLPTQDRNLIMHGYGHRVFAYAAHLARVEVDSLTGEVTVADYLAVSDTGQIFNPQLWEQQMQGGIAQGLGYALMEEMPSPGGVIATPDLATYLIPTALDLPEMANRAAVTYEEEGPLGLKGAGEVALDPVLPAVRAAVEDALGREIDGAPLTPERVLRALEGGAW